MTRNSLQCGSVCPLHDPQLQESCTARATSRPHPDCCCAQGCCPGACTQLGHLWSPTFVTVAGTANDTLQGKPLENILREKPSSWITDGWSLWRPPTLSTSGKGARDVALLWTVAVGGARAVRSGARPCTHVPSVPVTTAIALTWVTERCASPDRRHLLCIPVNKGMQDCSR